MLPKPVCLPLLVALLVLPTACTDESTSSSSRPSGSATSGATPAPTSPTDSPDPGDDPAAPPFPDVAPATGVVLVQPSVELRAPEGWQKSNELVEFSTGAYARGSASAQLTEQSALGGDSLGALTLDEQAESILKDARRDGGPWERLPDLVIGGVPMVQISGTNRRGNTELLVSVERSFEDDLKIVDFSIEAPAGYLERHPGLFESVLNTWTWH